jgi:hypothetical protein
MDTTTVQVKKVPNPTGKGGFQDHPELRNNGGRITNPLKEFQRELFRNMTDEEKKEYLKDIDKYRKWTMAEGTPEQPTDITSNGEGLTPILVKFMNGAEDEQK